MIHKNKLPFKKAIIGLLFLFSVLSANCVAGRADDSSSSGQSSIKIKAATDKNMPAIGQAQKKKLVNKVVKQPEEARQPSKEKRYKYDIKVSPAPKTAVQSPEKIKTRMHGERTTEPNSRIRYDIKMTPEENINGQSPEQIKTREHGKTMTNSDSRIKYDIQISPSENAPGQFINKIKTRKHGESGAPTDGGIKIQSSIKPIRKEEEPKYQFSVNSDIVEKIVNVQTHQATDNKQIKVTRIQTWKLDSSGNRTKEKITDSNKTIEGVFEPPSE